MASSHRPIDIIIPVYRNPAVLDSLLDSISGIREELNGLGCSIIAINDSPDDPEVSAVLSRASANLSACIPFEIVTNPENLGFVRSANRGLQIALERRHDVLLLNSDTLLFPGAVAEMRRVADLDPMIGFVSPRTNNATICSLPGESQSRNAEPAEAYAKFCKLLPRLPEYHLIPTAVGFCLFVKLEMIEEFGLLDECFGPGYNEENDFIMRANRCGYRAALANRAFVYHAGEVSFSSSRTHKSQLEGKNRAVLDNRYPNYATAVGQYLGSASYQAECMLPALVPDSDGRLGIVFDLGVLGPYHNGTAKAATELLRRAGVQWQDRFQVHVMASAEAARFHKLDEIPGVALVSPDSTKIFALAFRPAQPFAFEQVAQLSRIGVVNVYSMLDAIAFDCLHLNDVDFELVWGSVFQYADAVTYISEFTAGQFRRRFRRHARLRELISYLSLDVGDYPAPRDTGGTGSYILVVGNGFEHKFVKPTAEALRQAFPHEEIVALGIPPDSVPGVISYKAGKLSDAQAQDVLDKAKFVVFPSHYEGFGIPILESLACRKPVLARNTPLTRDLRDRVGTPENLLLYGTTRDLICRLAAGAPSWKEEKLTGQPGAGWDAVVAELGKFFDSLIESVSISDVLVPRLEFVRIMETYAGTGFKRGSAAPRRAFQNVAGLRAEIAALRNSTSWRITAPLRALFDVYLKLAGKYEGPPQ
jgi:GT2 family glycosyltransferase